MKNQLLFLIILIALFGCSPDEGGANGVNQGPETDGEVLFGGWALTHFENSTTPFVFVNDDNIVASVVDEDRNGIFDGSLIRTPEGTLLLDFDENSGMPKQITTSHGETMLFEFKDGNSKVDLAYIYNGEFQYFRDIDVESSGKQAPFSRFARTSNDTDLIDAFILTGNILSTTMSGAFCTAAIAATITSLGVAAPSLWTCAGFFVGLSSLIIDSGAVEANPEIFRGSSLVAVGASVVECAGTRSPGDCADAFLGVVSELKTAVDNVKTENSAEISAALGALQSGFGQVKVTLTWTSGADLDLWVTEPNGNKIFYANPNSSTGGYLDFDDLDGPGPENIFWTEGAPTGNYQVQVHNYSSNGATSSSYTVQTQINGVVNVYNGSISAENQVNNVVQFSIGPSNEYHSKRLIGGHLAADRLTK